MPEQLKTVEDMATEEIKEFSFRAKVEEVTQWEDMMQWAMTDEPYQRPVAPDLVVRAAKPPLYAIYSFARSCMP